MTESQEPPKDRRPGDDSKEPTTPTADGATAEERITSNNESLEKLKELEESLAKELDQHVNLTGPNEARLDSQISVNPSMEEALKTAQAAKNKPAATDLAAISASEGLQEIKFGKSEAASSEPIPGATVPVTGIATGPADSAPQNNEASNQERKEEDISLDEVDDILNQLDGTFKASLDEIKNEVSKVEVSVPLESAPIGADYLKSENKEGEALASAKSNDAHDQVSIQGKKSGKKKAPPALTLSQAVSDLVMATVFVMPRIARSIFSYVRESKALPPKEIVMGLPGVALPPVILLKGAIQNFFEVVTSFTLKTYALFGLTVALMALLGYLSFDIVSNFRTDKEKDPFLRSFNDVAGRMQIIPDDEDGEDLESPLKHSEYMVLVHKIVANLKPPHRRATPMVVAEFYIEASNQECAVEIHDREIEIRDVIERVFEETTFDDLDTPEGKTRLKIHIRTSINKILNHGSARRIFFKSLNMTE